MNRRRTAQSAFLNLRTSIVVLVCALAGYSVLNATLLGFFGPQASLKVSGRTLSFAERVSYQRAIEEVYWRHRIWPENHPDQKPPLDSGMSQAQVEKKVADYLRKSQALEDYWQRPITAEELQAEMDRMAVNTKQPDVLRELFETLGNDPFVIAECLARPITAERLLARLDAHERFAPESRLANAETKVPITIAGSRRLNHTLPVVGGPFAGCTEDTWTPTSLTDAPFPRASHTAVWTGSEMIIWGGGARVDGTTKIFTIRAGVTILSRTVGRPSARPTHRLPEPFTRRC